MKVKDLKTGSILTVDDSYGARLYEQGAAVPVAEEKKTAKPAKEKAPRKE